jgi:cystathionine gamma-synthase
MLASLVIFLSHVVHFFVNRDLPPAERLKYGIKDNLVRFSFGVEDFDDLKADIVQSLDQI